MKLIFVSVLFVGFVASALGDGCQYKENKLKVGEKYSPPGECVQYTCQEGGGITGLTCPGIAAPPECKYVPEDLSKPYPECCDQYDC